MADDDPPDSLAALRRDYEGMVMTIAEVCTHHGVTKPRLYQIANAEGWRLRSPRRVDKRDLSQRLLRLLHRQIIMLEDTMKTKPIDQSAVLGKLSATLDRLIAVDKQTAPPPRRSHDSKMMTEIRAKVAERLAQLDGE